MIKQLGTKLYFNKLTGDVLLIVGDMQGYVRETTFEEDVVTYEQLKTVEDVATIGLKEFAYGEYPTLSEGFNQVRVNVETEELEFSYVEPELPSDEEQLSEIEKQIAELEAKKAEMIATMASKPEALI